MMLIVTRIIHKDRSPVKRKWRKVDYCTDSFYGAKTTDGIHRRKRKPPFHDL